MPRISQEKKQDTRTRLLEVAARHFARHGWAGTRVDPIATEAGFAKGTLYNYFPSKDALFAAVIEEGARRAVEHYRTRPHGGSTRERLLALARADVQVLREDEDFVKVMVREAMSFRPETYPLIVQHLAPFIHEVETALADGVASGEVRGDRPAPQLALAFTGLLSLLYVQRWGTQGAWPSLEEIPTLVTTLFLDGAAQRSAP